YKLKTQIISGEAIVRRQHSGFEVQVGSHLFSSKFVILATGLKDIQIPNINYRELTHNGVFAYCPICDGFDHADKKIAVFINSKAGFRKVRFLYNYSKNLHVIILKPIPLTARIQKEMD